MTIRTEAIQALRLAFKDGATIGHLVNIVVDLYRLRSQPLSGLELERCFEEAFDLNIGSMTAELSIRMRGKPEGPAVGRATAFIFPTVLENRESWDSVDSCQPTGSWLEALPVIEPANTEAFDRPLIPEWDHLSRSSQLYIIRHAISSAVCSRSLLYLACLAERLQDKLVAASKTQHPLVPADS